jgi:hypothetical protein
MLALPEAEIALMEKLMLASSDVQDIPVTHYLNEVKGIYMREGKVKADRYVLGDRHKTRHYMILFSGTMRMVNGDKVEEITGPNVILCEPNIRKLAYTVTDIHGINVMATDEVDVASIEQDLIEKSDTYNQWKLLSACAA